MMVTRMNRIGAEPPDEGVCNDNEDYEWTAKQVGELIKQACKTKDGHISVMIGRRKLMPVGTLPPGADTVLSWPARYCSEDDWQALIIWGTAESWRKRGISLAELRREMGKKEAPSTFDRRRKRALDQIAASLKKDRVPRFRL